MNSIIRLTEEFVYRELSFDASGHDWHHIDRVRKTAKYICEMEGKGDPFTIEMASLLHDIPDEKVNSSKESGEEKLIEFLHSLSLEPEREKKILDIINTISFKGGNEAELHSFEAMIVRDADRIDAIGAIGVARAFAFGGKKGHPLHEPEYSIREHMTLEEYRNGNSSTIHHFYEKLLLLKDRLHTTTAKRIAEKRHRFMEEFLQQFYKEWNGNDEITYS